MISVYDSSMTEFPTLGRILMPTSCTVNEVAGGQYECTLVHPIDPEGRWKDINVHNVLKLPVPHMPVPATVLSVPATNPNKTTYKYYTTNKATSVYKYPSTSVVVGSIAAGVRCEYAYAIEGDFVKVFTPYTDLGIVYVSSSDVDYSEYTVQQGEAQAESTTTVGAHSLDDQCFRIYKTQVDSSGLTITAYARHVFYDLAYSFFGSADFSIYPSTVVQVASIMINGRDSVTGMPSGYYGGNGKAFAAVNIPQVEYKENISWQNVISMLVDPDNGMVSKARCRLIRDNYMIYLVGNSETGDFSIAYGKNLKSIKFSYNTEDAVTAIIPIAHGVQTFTCPGTDEYPMIYYNSSSAARDSYPFSRVQIIEVDTDVNDVDGWKKMKEEALAVFSEGCELTKLNVQVNFINLGDTDEFKQYRNLQNVYLYDTVRIDHAPLGFSDKLQVKEYEWDAVLQRYNRLVLGDVFDSELGTIPAYQLKSGSVALSKIRKDEIAAYIKKVVDE